MSVLRVQQITNEAGNGPVEFTKGVVYVPSLTNSELSINTSGIATFSQIVINSVTVVGVMTAGSFAGNGFNITNPPGTPVGKVIGQHLIT